MSLNIERTASAYQPAMTIGSLLEGGVRRSPKQEIVYGNYRTETYAEMSDRVHRLGGALTKLGVKPGNVVAVMDWDSHRYLECFYGVPMLGAVLHTVNVRLSPEQILYTINHAQDDVILVHRDFAPLVAQIRERIERPVKLVLLSDEAGGDAPGLEVDGEYEALLAEAAPGFEFPELHEDTRATTFYTTGTTGLPKGVYFSHRQLVMHTLASMTVMVGAGQGQWDRHDVYMPLTPMFHVHAWGIPYVATLLGVKQVYPGRYEPASILKLFIQHKVTFSHCVPTIMQMLLAAEAATNVDFSNWTVIIGGAALPAAMARAAMERGIDIYTGYGMSETCPLLTLALLTPELEKADLDTQIDYRTRTGRAVPMVDLRIVDPEMKDVPHDGKARGEIVVRAPWLTQGYLRDPGNSETLWHGGWLHTGDVAVMDEDGWVKIVDRIKDVIKTGGEWLSSIELESMILHHPAVAECAVIGVPDPKWDERPLALVVLKPGHKAEVADIQKQVSDYADKGIVSKYAVPERVTFVDSLPRTSVGKLDKKLMRQQHS